MAIVGIVPKYSSSVHIYNIFVDGTNIAQHTAATGWSITLICHSYSADNTNIAKSIIYIWQLRFGQLIFLLLCKLS